MFIKIIKHAIYCVWIYGMNHSKYKKNQALTLCHTFMPVNAFLPLSVIFAFVLEYRRPRHGTPARGPVYQVQLFLQFLLFLSFIRIRPPPYSRLTGCCGRTRIRAIRHHPGRIHQIPYPWP